MARIQIETDLGPLVIDSQTGEYISSGPLGEDLGLAGDPRAGGILAGTSSFGLGAQTGIPGIVSEEPGEFIEAGDEGEFGEAPPEEEAVFDPSNPEHIILDDKLLGGTWIEWADEEGNIHRTPREEVGRTSQVQAANLDLARQKFAYQQAQDLLKQQNLVRSEDLRNQLAELTGQQRAEETERGREFEREQTLLGLGSRPETLIKYLFALRGLLPPQQLGGVPGALGGLPEAPGAPQAPGLSSAGLIGSSPSALLETIPQEQRAALGDPLLLQRIQEQQGIERREMAAPRLPAPTVDLGSGTAGGRQIVGGTIAPGTTLGQLTDDQIRLASGLNLGAGEEFKRRARLGILDHGGILDEPTLSTGLRTGRQNLLAYSAPEAVVPLNFAPPSLFNPPSLTDIVNRPELAPGVPNFPQTGYFTGGGQSLIPSAQKLTQSTGTERSLYSGFLQDIAGVPPEDIEELTRKLSPTIRGLTTPRYA